MGEFHAYVLIYLRYIMKKKKLLKNTKHVKGTKCELLCFVRIMKL